MQKIFYCSCKIILSIFLEKNFFDPTCPFCMGYRLTKMVDFQNALISGIFGFFCYGLFAQKISIVFMESFLACFWKKMFFYWNCLFCMGYRLTKIVDLQNAFISRIFGVFFLAVCCTEQLYCSCISFSACFQRKCFLTQTAHFAWAIDLRKWSIFKLVSFFEEDLFEYSESERSCLM